MALLVVIHFESLYGVIIQEDANMPALMCLVAIEMAVDFPLALFKPSFIGFAYTGNQGWLVYIPECKNHT